MKKIKILLSIVATFILLVGFTQCTSGGKDAMVKRFMKSQAKEVNKVCPMTMANGVILKGCTIEDDKTFRYEYEVNDQMANGINISGLKPLMVGALNNLPYFDKLKEYEISFLYCYYDSDGEFLGELKISPHDYV